MNYEYKYKPGDAVIIRKDLNLYDRYYMGDKNFKRSNVVIEEMMDLRGKVAHIKRYSENGQYKLEEDISHCNWTDKMFENIGLGNCLFHGLI